METKADARSSPPPLERAKEALGLIDTFKSRFVSIRMKHAPISVRAARGRRRSMSTLTLRSVDARRDRGPGRRCVSA